MKEAVMIVLRKDDRFLLGKRSPWKPKAPGYWCPISGHMEAQESEEAAVIREAREELGVPVTPLRKITSMLTHDKSVRLHWWLARIDHGEAKLNNDENSELGWFTKDELRELSPVFTEDIAVILSIE